MTHNLKLYVLQFSSLDAATQCLASQQPALPGLAALLLLHTKYICAGYVTTVLVRHWAVLYQQMGQSQQNNGQLNERTAREPAPSCLSEGRFSRSVAFVMNPNLSAPVVQVSRNAHLGLF